MALHVKLTYLYRDGSNYKSWNSIIFANPSGFPLDELSIRLQRACLVDRTFIADQVRIPEMFLYSAGTANDDDHCLHEFYSIEATEEEPDDAHARSIDEFVLEIERASSAGWSGFDPQWPSLPRRRFLQLF